MNLSATICISRDNYQPSLESLMALNDPDELCISPNAEQADVCEAENADVCIECTPSNPWDPYGRHQLYDAASGDWFLTIDDDDLAVEPLRPHLAEVDDDVGLVFGDVIMRWQGRGGLTHREELRRNDHDFSNCSCAHGQSSKSKGWPYGWLYSIRLRVVLCRLKFNALTNQRVNAIGYLAPRPPAKPL